MNLRPLLRTLRAGDTRARLSALRTARHALTVAVTGAALRTGLLVELREPGQVPDVARRRGWDPVLTEALLESFAAHGLLVRTPTGWCTSPQGQRILDDEVVSAAYEAFATYHTGLYRDLEPQLRSGGERQDIELDGELIARLSRFMDEFVLAELDRVVAERPPTRLLDVGCGAAAHLRHVLRRVPDVRDFLDRGAGEVFDLVLLANVIYYVPVGERVALLTALAERLRPGGRLMVVTTALTDDSFSRHFDLLLRAQRGAAELPVMEVLADQVRQAGLEPEAPRRIAPGEPLTALLARRR